MKLYHRFVSFILGLFMLVPLLPAEVNANPSAQERKVAYTPPSDKLVTSQQDYSITSGVTKSHLVMTDIAGENQIYAFVATISPTAKATFKVNYPGYYTEGSTEASRKALAQNLT